MPTIHRNLPPNPSFPSEENTPSSSSKSIFTLPSLHQMPKHADISASKRAIETIFGISTKKEPIQKITEELFATILLKGIEDGAL